MAYFFCTKEPMDGVVVARELGDQMTFLVGFDVQETSLLISCLADWL